jgi:hypothetical protein
MAEKFRFEPNRPWRTTSGGPAPYSLKESSSDTIPSALFHANQTVYPVSAKTGRFPPARSGYGRTTAA